MITYDIPKYNLNNMTISFIISDYLRLARLCAGQQYCQSLETLQILPQIGSIAARTTYICYTYYTYQGQRILNTVQILLTHKYAKQSNFQEQLLRRLLVYLINSSMQQKWNKTPQLEAKQILSSHEAQR